MKTKLTKREQIKILVEDILKESHKAMVKKIDEVLESGAIDVDGWDDINAPMILPKCIVTAILQNESRQYECKGTSYEKQVKKEVKNIRNFL